jgi:hypothetical protein
VGFQILRLLCEKEWLASIDKSGNISLVDDGWPIFLAGIGYGNAATNTTNIAATEFLKGILNSHYSKRNSALLEGI